MSKAFAIFCATFGKGTIVEIWMLALRERAMILRSSGWITSRGLKYDLSNFECKAKDLLTAKSTHVH